MFAALIAAFFLSMLAIPVLMRMAVPLGLTDQPGGRKVHLHPIPRVGGIGIAFGTFLPVLLWLPLNADVVLFVAGGLILAVVGVLDDRFDLDYRIKLVGQIAAAGVAVWGGILITSLPFVPVSPLPPYVAYPLTVAFLVAVTNAVNFLDGLDGLAAGYSVITLCALGLMAYLATDYVAAFIAAALIGSLFGFLRYNTHPARVFMGDAGSQLLGFGSAALALLLTRDRTGYFNAAFPFVLLGLPLIDVTFVIATRLRQGRSPFSADRNHIHHRLLELGFSHRETVSIIYVLQAIFVFAAILLRHEHSTVLATVFLAMGGTLLALLCWARFRAWRLVRAGSDVEAEKAGLIADRAGLRRAICRLIEGSAAAFLVVGACFAADISKDVAFMAAVLAGGVVACLIVSRQSANGLFRLAAYLASLFVAYFLDGPMEANPALRWTVYLYLFGLAVCVFGAIKLSDERSFKPTPQDLLILCLIVFFMALPGEIAQQWHLGSLFFKAAVLFYATEILYSQTGWTWLVLNTASLLSLAIFAVRGWPA